MKKKYSYFPCSWFLAFLCLFSSQVIGNEKYQENAFNINKYPIPSKDLISILDSIFSKSNVMKDEEHFQRKGFIIIHRRPSGLIIAKHPSLPGYLVKIYLNDLQRSNEEIWQKFTNRCIGAENIRLLISAKKLKHFSVPNKWIYTSPYQKETAILIVTDMNIVSSTESKNRWKNNITDKHLDELYCIISHGYASSSLPRNIPYSKDGKFACIDTEHPQRIPQYERVKIHLSKKMQIYWDKLVKNENK